MLIDDLRGRSENGVGSIRVFTIAYGHDANQDVLTSIAAAAGGEEYAGDTSEIDSVYRQISSFF
jgi:Ca-activated chloride channel family protein